MDRLQLASSFIHSTPVMALSFAVYGLITALLTAFSLWHAFNLHTHYYPAITYLFSSKLNLLALLNVCIFCLLVSGKVVRSLFLGSLSADESQVFPPTPLILIYNLDQLTTFPSVDCGSRTIRGDGNLAGADHLSRGAESAHVRHVFALVIRQNLSLARAASC
jgi:hypothetical protein